MTKVETILEYYVKNNKNRVALRIPKEAWCLFPPPARYYDSNCEWFPIQSAGNKPDKVHVALPHPGGLNHIHMTKTNWWKNINQKPPGGSTVVIEVTESDGGKKYRI